MTHNTRAYLDWLTALSLYHHKMFQTGAIPHPRAIPWHNTMTIAKKDAFDTAYEEYLRERGR